MARLLIAENIDQNQAKIKVTGLPIFKELALAWMKDRQGSIKPATMIHDP